MPDLFKCPNCRAPLPAELEARLITCTYCGHRLVNPYYDASDEAADDAAPESSAPTEQETIAEPEFEIPSAGGHKRAIVVFVVLILLLMVVSWFVSYLSYQSDIHQRIAAATGDTDTTKTPASRPEPKPPMTAQRRLELKLAPAVDCLHMTVRLFPRVERRYRSRLKRGPGGKRSCRGSDLRRAVDALSDWPVQRCRKAVRLLQKLPPSLPELERAIDAHTRALVEVFRLTTRAHDYYRSGRYRADNCALGQKLHPLLLAAFKQANQTFTRARSLLAPRVQGTLQRCLTRALRDELPQPTPVMARTVKAAGDLVQALQPARGGRRPSPKVLNAAVETYRQALVPLPGLGQAGWKFRTLVENLYLLELKGADLVARARGRRFKQRGRGTFQRVVEVYQDILLETHTLEGCGRLLVCFPEECPEPR